MTGHQTVSGNGLSGLASAAIAYDVLQRNPQLQGWGRDCVVGFFWLAMGLLPVYGVGMVVGQTDARYDPVTGAATQVFSRNVGGGLACIAIGVGAIGLKVRAIRWRRQRAHHAERARRDFEVGYREQFCLELGGRMGHSGMEKLWRIWTAAERSYAEQAWLDDLLRGWERRHPAEWPSQTDARAQGYLCTCLPPQHGCGITGRLRPLPVPASPSAPERSVRDVAAGGPRIEASTAQGSRLLRAAVAERYEIRR